MSRMKIEWLGTTWASLPVLLPSLLGFRSDLRYGVLRLKRLSKENRKRKDAVDRVAFVDDLPEVAS